MSDAIQRTAGDERLSTQFLCPRCVPAGMRIPVKVLARCLDVGESTLTDINRSHRMPVRKIGREDWIDTDEWWESLPRKDYEKESRKTSQR